jgi:predicted dehydrogenase
VPARPIRVAIVGTGGIARVHAAALGTGAVLAAADVDAERLAAFAREHGVAATYRELGDLLREARPDLVHVCTPPHAHQTLGRPLLAVCHTTWFRDQAYFGVPWRGRWETEGGGPTMGHGIHQMDMLLDVLGDWAEVRAIARRQARRTRTEDLSLAHVTFASGAVASVVNSVLSPREESYLRFDFEQANVEVTHLYGYAGYGGLFWRGPAAFAGGRVLPAAAELAFEYLVVVAAGELSTGAIGAFLTDTG